MNMTGRLTTPATIIGILILAASITHPQPLRLDFSPTRDTELTLDEHTRALFHFNDDTTGRSHACQGNLPVETR